MKKTVITIETFQRTTMRLKRVARIVRCERCAAEAPSETAAQLETAVREAFRITDAGVTESRLIKIGQEERWSTE